MEANVFSDRIFTIEEVSQHLRVPDEAVLEEVNAGRLRAFRLGKYLRIRESALNVYLNSSVESLDASAVKSPPLAAEIKKLNSIDFSPAAPFNHTWPDKTTERFTEVSEGIVSDGDRERRVKIGFTLRDSAGKRRRRSLVLVDRYPTVEFVAADEKVRGRMASIIRDRNGKQLPVGATLPPEYMSLPVGPYSEVVQGPRASNGIAVVCDSRDLAIMVKHAMIRYKFREARANQ